jgi:hypothetical protein
LLRLAKAGVAAVLGLVVFVVAVALFGESPSVPLALLAWLAGAAFVLLVETSPL